MHPAGKHPEKEKARYVFRSRLSRCIVVVEYSTGADGPPAGLRHRAKARDIPRDME